MSMPLRIPVPPQISVNSWTNASTTNASTSYVIAGNTASNLTIVNTSTGPLTLPSTITHISNSTFITDPNIAIVNALLDESELVAGGVYKLPDGAKLFIDFNGNYEIIEHNAKVTYKANSNREFNQYINTSDLLEDFIGDLGALGVKQGEVLEVPLEAFINWLVLKAADADGEPVPVGVPMLEAPRNECRYCGVGLEGKFRELGMGFCSVGHFEAFGVW